MPPKQEPSGSASSSLNLVIMEAVNEEVPSVISSKNRSGVSPLQSSAAAASLPTIPSFSEFMKSRKAKDRAVDKSETVEKTMEKRMRLH